MYTQCPDCLTVFSLDAKTLTQARGEVVCGHCHGLFDALQSLNGQLPPEPFQQLPLAVYSDRPPQLELAVYRPQAAIPAAVVDAPTAATGEDFGKLVFAPRFARDERIRGPRRWPWVLLVLLLAVLLAVQLAWTQREALIANPTTGAWLRQACASLHCKIPLVQDVRQLRLLARDVQAHPTVSGALMISATVRNDAAFDQPYPVVVITLSDAAGKRVAMRRLRPEEYLGDAAQVREGLAAGSSTALVFEVQDPGQQAVAFDFAFE
jgi:predicted Zn finger-like uncharacterized protein